MTMAVSADPIDAVVTILRDAGFDPVYPDRED